MGSQLCSAGSYQLALGQGSLSLLPMPPSLAQPLGEAFAAIDPWAAYGYPAAAIASYLAGDEAYGVRFLLQVEGEAAGAFGLQPIWLRGPYIRFLAILPAFQGRGIGSAILTWLEDEARKEQERNLWVVASRINVDAIRFYERRGFLLAAELDGLAYDNRTELLFRKRL